MNCEYIKHPGTVDELNWVTHPYECVGLPGACGLMDVVHVKWSSCPAGDYNQAKGKEGYSTLGFQCITDFNRHILGVYGPQFGTVNNKHIVKTDPNLRDIQYGWFKDICWQYYTTGGKLHSRDVCT
jgi:hypothetical protein